MKSGRWCAFLRWSHDQDSKMVNNSLWIEHLNVTFKPEVVLTTRLHPGSQLIWVQLSVCPAGGKNTHYYSEAAVASSPTRMGIKPTEESERREPFLWRRTGGMWISCGLLGLPVSVLKDRTHRVKQKILKPLTFKWKCCCRTTAACCFADNSVYLHKGDIQRDFCSSPNTSVKSNHILFQSKHNSV